MYSVLVLVQVSVTGLWTFNSRNGCSTTYKWDIPGMYLLAALLCVSRSWPWWNICIDAEVDLKNLALNKASISWRLSCSEWLVVYQDNVRHVSTTIRLNRQFRVWSEVSKNWSTDRI